MLSAIYGIVYVYVYQGFFKEKFLLEKFINFELKHAVTLIVGGRGVEHMNT